MVRSRGLFSVIITLRAWSNRVMLHTERIHTYSVRIRWIAVSIVFLLDRLRNYLKFPAYNLHCLYAYIATRPETMINSLRRVPAALVMFQSLKDNAARANSNDILQFPFLERRVEYLYVRLPINRATITL